MSSTRSPRLAAASVLTALLALLPALLPAQAGSVPSQAGGPLGGAAPAAVGGIEPLDNGAGIDPNG
jgi:hypothetical protein